MKKRNSRCPIALPIASVVVVIGLFAVVGCNHTESYTRDMTWSSDANFVGLRTLPEGAIRLTFVTAPEFYIGLRIAGFKERLERSGKRTVPVQFEIQCSHRHFALIRVRSVDGRAVQTTSSNMWMAKGSVDGLLPGPFPGACWY